MRPGTASVCARSADSRTVIKPSGLSSRTTSPVSVIHDVVRSPWYSISTRNAGIGRSPVFHDFAIADVHGDRSVPQRRRIEDGPLLLGTCGETTAGEQPRKI